MCLYLVLFALYCKMQILLLYFHICRSPMQFSTVVHFCYYFGRDSLQSTQCGASGDGWMPNFILNEGSIQTADAIPLHSYYSISGQSTHLFLHNNVNVTAFRPPKTFYLPGKQNKNSTLKQKQNKKSQK